MKTLAASLSILTQQGVMLYLLRGVAFTCIISVLGVILGLIVGSLLALARTYCKHGPARVLGWLSAAYIELFRNTPYLLWIFVCVVFCPCPAFFARKMFGLTSVEMKLLFKAALALILFNSSVIAEIVRGGLNGVAKGQFEAGYAQGFNTAQPGHHHHQGFVLSGKRGHHRADGPHPPAAECRGHLQRSGHRECFRRYGPVRCRLRDLLHHQLHAQLHRPFDAEQAEKSAGLCPGKERRVTSDLIFFLFSYFLFYLPA